MGPLTAILTLPLLAQSAPSPQPFPQRLLAEEPEVRRLLEALRPAEAHARMETLLSEPRVAFDAKDANTTHQSSLRALYYSRALILAVQTAEFSGRWEQAVTYAKEGAAIAQENHDQCQKVLAPMAEGFQKMANEARAFLDKNAATLKELESKQSVSESEWNLIEQAQGFRAKLAEGEKWGKFFQDDLDRAKADLERWPAGLADSLAKKITDQDAEIAGYKVVKGDKVKWAEAVVGSRAYMANYATPRDKVAFLHRLLVLAPGNAKIQKVLEGAWAGDGSTNPPQKPSK